jgi:hypothetical protein
METLPLDPGSRAPPALTVSSQERRQIQPQLISASLTCRRPTRLYLMRRAKPSPLRASCLQNAMAILVDADLLARQQGV